MIRHRQIALLVLVALVAAGAALAQEAPKVTFGGATYTKWLWGNQRLDGSLYNFTTVPGEGYGDNGQGTEIEVFIDGRLSRAVSFHARLHSRFNQNEWTNGGGWGFPKGGDFTTPNDCIGGNCGEFDPRSNQYVKLRGVSVYLTPGYSWLDMATIGSSDWGMFDPFVVGKIRYIDRDNVAGVLLQGSGFDKQFGWDAARISLYRNWMGPLYSTGRDSSNPAGFAGEDASYVLQLRGTMSSMFDIAAIWNYVNDMEVNQSDLNADNGRATKQRYRNSVYGGRIGIHPSPIVDIGARFYHSLSATNNLFLPVDFSGVFLAGAGGFSPVPLGTHEGNMWRANVDFNDPFGAGLSFKLEGFDIGAEYISLLAARRETDVLLTEGHDAAFTFAGVANTRYQPFPSAPFSQNVIGYGGWDGNAQQFATVNVDNEFTDFDEPLAETAIGWKGFTVVPIYTKGSWELAGEYTHIGYNTNWQNWGNPGSVSIFNHTLPGFELDTGPGVNPNVAYIPYQADKKTDIALVRFKGVLEVGEGIDIFGKVKHLKDKDLRLNGAEWLPYVDGDCPAAPALDAGCANVARANNGATDQFYSNPPVITGANDVVGYQWKPFDSISDDDRDVKYWMYQLGAGYQLSHDLYAALTYEYFNVELHDGDTAWQAYNTQEFASGKHKKNRVTLKAKYTLAGADFGFEYQYAFGTFEPDFGGGFVPQVATEEIATKFLVPVGSLGFTGRYGGWNSMRKRDLDNQRIKAYMKIQF